MVLLHRERDRRVYSWLDSMKGRLEEWSVNRQGWVNEGKPLGWGQDGRSITRVKVTLH